MTARQRRWLNAAIVTGVAAVGIAALVSALRSDGETSSAAPPVAETETETGPADTGGVLPGELPEIITLPAELREEGGLLWWAGGDCEVSVLDASSGLVADAPAGMCDIWPAPDGATAIASVLRGDSPEAYGVAVLPYPPPEGETVLVSGEVFEDALALLSPSAWHPAGDRVAVCAPRQDGIFVDVLDVDDGTRSSVADIGSGGSTGFCHAAFLPDGRLAVARDGATIELDGREIFGEPDAALLLPNAPDGARSVTALGAGAGLLVAGLRSDEPSSAAIAVIAPDGTIEFSAHLRPDSYPAAAGVAPDGRSLWYLNASTGAAVILQIPGGRRSELYRARWLAWSPDGDYLAAVVNEGIELISLPDGHLVATLNVPADIVTWTGQPEDG